MRRGGRRALAAYVVLVALLGTGCTLTGLHPSVAAVEEPRPFRLGRDTFAFPNLVRAERPDQAVTFANYCLVMVRAAVQFHRFARFDPDQLPPDDAALAGRLRDILGRDPWAEVPPAAERLIVPGYRDLYQLSERRERVVKEALGPTLPSMIHPRTWRISLALSPAHQAGVADRLRAAAAVGRPVPLMLTNFPEPDLLNHAVLVYARRGGGEFLAYDPNDPWSPLELHFDRVTGSFAVGPLPYSPPGPIRVFQLYTSSWF